MTTQYKLLYINNPGTETDIDEDISGNNNDGTIYGATQVDGKLGDCLSFDGVDDYVDAGNGASLDITSAITIEMWLKRNDIGSIQSIIGKGDESGAWNYKLTFLSNNTLELYAGGGTVASNTAFSQIGVWYHVVVTISSTTYTFYINSTLDKTGSLVGSMTSNTRSLQIGRSWGVAGEGTQYFKGLIDEIRIYSRALNQTEINSRYNGGTGKILNPSTETNLKGYWRFDPVGFDDISMYMGDFKLERELEKMLDKLTLKISRSIDSAANFVGFDPNIEILFKFNNIGIFRGKVKTSNKKEYYDVEVYSSAEILNRTIAKKVYENMSPESIFSDLITTYSDLTPSTAVSNNTIKRLVADDYVGTIIQKLAEALGWSIYTNSSKTIFFRPRGNITNATIIRRQATSANAIFGQWKKDSNEMCNNIKLTGENISYSTQESFIGNGVTTEFYITEQPTNIKVTINGIEQSIGSYSVDAEIRKITFQSAPSNNSSIIFTYSYVYPIYVERSDTTSISTYGTFSKNLVHKWIKTRSDAITFCDNYINTYKNPLLSNNLIMNATHITTFTPGEQVRIIDDLETYDDNYIINKIKLELTKGYVELNVGSYIPVFINLQTSIQDRIKELEKSLSKSVIQIYNTQSETLVPSETLNQSSANYMNFKIQVTYPAKCDYGRGTLYDARCGLCQA